MLLSLFHWLSGYVRAFAVFDYLSLRAVLAALTALVIGLAFGPFTIRELKKLHFGQAVRTDGPKSHLKKDGTPTMGGILILPRSRFPRCSGWISQTAISGWCSW